ncbi:MAG: DJ-1/PfpI family protein [Ruminococcus sp.]|jgi:4-methyl-5(b-hydroxyethyl)-thiazole monophosphate biosynthesis|nr:DJ-1/PfpI family protein [Ruminococcus sp.]
MIYLMLADGFEVTEALTTVDVLRRAKLELLTVGVTGRTVTASCGIKVEADIMPDEVELDRLDAVILPGGLDGTRNLGKSEFVSSVLDYAVENDKYTCAICAAPSILAKKGILDGKNATCFPGCEVSEDKVNYTGEPAVCDGKAITGKGAGCTIHFGLLIAEKMAGKEVSDHVKATMQCP